MAMNVPLLADQIAASLGHSGNVTIQVTAFARGIIEEIQQNGVATTGSSPGPHQITSLSGSSLASRISSYAGYGFVSGVLANYCNAIVTYIMANAIITYTGPGGLPPLFFTGGTVTGLVGSDMAALIASMAPYPGVTSELIAKSTAICNHIMVNAEANSGSIA